jgi:shikimate kinase
MKASSRFSGTPIVLVGLMGAGKTSVGRRLAARLSLPFRDADEEIEKAAGCSIEDIFALYGEPAFRDGERKVIARLLSEGPQVLATGGGAFCDSQTRARICAEAISIWLKADAEELYRRVSHQTHRPLLKKGDPLETLRRLMDVRYPLYAEAHIHVESGSEAPEVTVDNVQRKLLEYLERTAAGGEK